MIEFIPGDGDNVVGDLINVEFIEAGPRHFHVELIKEGFGFDDSSLFRDELER